MSPAKHALNARVRLVAGPAKDCYGTIVASDAHAWTADVKLDDGRTCKNVPLKHVELVAEEQVTDREKLLDRIRKIWAKAESLKAMGPAYEKEALTFAANAQKMLNKYKLSLNDLQMAEAALVDTIGEDVVRGDDKRSIPDWVRTLAHLVARAHFCRAIMERGSDRVWLVGRESDRKVAGFVLGVLRRVADDMSDQAARKFRKEQRRTIGMTTQANRNYRAAWLDGFIGRIAERYRDEERTMAKEKNASGTSLVLVRTKTLAEVDEFVTANIALGKARKARSGGRQAGASASDVGRAAGRAAGNTVNIRGTGLGSSPDRTKKLR